MWPQIHLKLCLYPTLLSRKLLLETVLSSDDGWQTLRHVTDTGGKDERFQGCGFLPHDQEQATKCHEFPTNRLTVVPTHTSEVCGVPSLDVASRSFFLQPSNGVSWDEHTDLAPPRRPLTSSQTYFIDTQSLSVSTDWAVLFAVMPLRELAHSVSSHCRIYEYCWATGCSVRMMFLTKSLIRPVVL